MTRRVTRRLILCGIDTYFCAVLRYWYPPHAPLVSARDLSRAVSGSVKSLPQEENLSSAWLGCNFGAADQIVTQAGRRMYPHYGVLVESDLQIEIHSKEL